MTLSCNVDGNPAPSISWTTDGFQVNTTINSRISFSADKKQLTITKVKRTDNGNYGCVANNSLGNATSDAATVDVQCKCSILVNKSKPNSCTITNLHRKDNKSDYQCWFKGITRLLSIVLTVAAVNP